MPTIRPLTYADLLPASKVLDRAFRNAYLFGPFMHPHREQYPEDTYLYWLRRLRLAYFSGPDNYLFVSYSKSKNPNEPDEITGLSQWKRLRDGSFKKSWYRKKVLWGVKSYNSLEDLIYTNRAADPSKNRVLEVLDGFISHHWTGKRADVWYLQLLAVDPGAGGQGIGKELVRWGFERAKEEGVGASVVCADGKEEFYRRCGFNAFAGFCSEAGGDDNPVREGAGGTIMFWDNEEGFGNEKKEMKGKW